jgi:putative phosphoesterase
MKIAVISDIHGNFEALEAVLNDIREQGCEKIFVLGDYAMAGPEPSKTLNWFFERRLDSNIIMIQGNTDLMISNYSEELYESVKSRAPIMAEALKDDVTLLTPVQKDFLRNLPTQIEVLECGMKFLLVHGSPRRNNEDILPETTLDKLEEMLEGVNADIVLCGHTHLPCGFQTENKKTVVNVGSVGRPFTLEPQACYLKITLNNGEAIFEHRFVDYDKEKSSLILKNRSFNGAEKLAGMLLNPTQRHF